MKKMKLEQNKFNVVFPYTFTKHLAQMMEKNIAKNTAYYLKQLGLLFILSIIPLFASAHAGPFDRYLQQMVSSRTLLVILLLTHLCVYLLMRFGASIFPKL